MAEFDDYHPAKKAKHSPVDRNPGILFTFGQPSKIQQATNSLLSALDRLNDETVLPADAIETSNVSDTITQELAALKKDRKRFRFSAELSRGCGLLSCPKKAVPSEIVYSLLKDNCPVVPLSLVSRVDPLDVVCAPNLSSFESVCVPAIKQKFEGIEKDVTWKVIFDKHGETNISKEKVIDLAHSVIPERHESSVHEPEIVILVHIFQSICGVGFVREYDQLCQYNIRKLITKRIQEGDN
jgi:hypothetical protein